MKGGRGRKRTSKRPIDDEPRLDEEEERVERDHGDEAEDDAGEEDAAVEEAAKVSVVNFGEEGKRGTDRVRKVGEKKRTLCRGTAHRYRRSS